MKLHVTLIAILLCLLGNAQQMLPNFQKHTVKKGDTPNTISSQYKISVRDFLLINDFPYEVKLSPGQEVLIKQLNPGEKPIEEPTVTRPADKLAEIKAERRNENSGSPTDKTTVTKSETTNTYTTGEKTENKPQLPVKKEKATIPASETANIQPAVTKADFVGPGGVKYEASSTGYYTVKSGQTFYRIALIHGLTVDELKGLNNLSNTNVEVGQRLRVGK